MSKVNHPCTVAFHELSVDLAKVTEERDADTLEHGFFDDEGHHIQYSAEIRALAKEIKSNEAM